MSRGSRRCSRRPNRDWQLLLSEVEGNGRTFALRRRPLAVAGLSRRIIADPLLVAPAWKARHHAAALPGHDSFAAATPLSEVAELGARFPCHERARSSALAQRAVPSAAIVALQAIRAVPAVARCAVMV